MATGKNWPIISDNANDFLILWVEIVGANSHENILNLFLVTNEKVMHKKSSLEKENRKNMASSFSKQIKRKKKRKQKS